MDFQTYIKPELLVLIPVLYIIGMMMKKTRKISNRYIPVMLGCVGVVLAMIWTIGTEVFSMVGLFTGFTQGVLVAGAAVYADQIIKQAKKVQ